MIANRMTRKPACFGLWIGALGIAMLLSGCHTSLQTFKVAGESMLPSFHPGDLIFADAAENVDQICMMET
jgi:signal peptidase I